LKEQADIEKKQKRKQAEEKREQRHANEAAVRAIAQRSQRKGYVSPCRRLPYKGRFPSAAVIGLEARRRRAFLVPASCLCACFCGKIPLQAKCQTQQRLFACGAIAKTL